MRKRLHHRNSARGIALYLTLITLAILSILGFGLVTVTTSHGKANLNLENSSKAYYIARTGIARAMNCIKDDYWWATSSEYVLQTSSYGTNRISVWAPTSNLTSSRKVWKITSTGEYAGSTRVLTAWMELESFALFCYFSDNEKIGSTTIWFSGRDRLEGPVHTNGYFSINTNPVFTSRVTSSNNGDSYYTSSPSRKYKQGNVWYTDPFKFYRYYSNYNQDEPTSGGQDFFFAGGQPEVPLPANANEIKTLADKNYTYDLYIKFNESGTATVKYKVGSVWKTDTLDTSNLTIHTTQNVYFQDNNCKLNGRTTVAADKTIYLQNSVEYKNTATDVLGLVAGANITIDTATNVQKDIKIHATMMALNGSFSVADYNKGIRRGYIRLFGGLIQDSRGAVGTFNGTTTQTGYDKDYKYDTKLANSPPPNYPTTGKLKIISIEDRTALGSRTN